MMFYILAFLFVSAHAVSHFNVTDKNISCLLLELDGHVNLEYNKTTVTLNFENATVIQSSSNCTLIKLNLTKSVEVWFQFNDINNSWQVVPVAFFQPNMVFPGKFNISDNATYAADPLEVPFKKNESYQCLAETSLKFVQSSKPEFNITLGADTLNFKIQAIQNETKFVDGQVCQKDKPTTPVPTTHAPTHVPTSPVTPMPTSQNFTCEDHHNNVTKFRVVGSFVLSVTYETMDKKKKTVLIDVPQVQPDSILTDCTTSNTTEKLVFKFLTNWSIEIIFETDIPKSNLLGASSKFYISNITVTYYYDNKLLPNSSASGYEFANSTKPKYLETSTNGYYTCKDIPLVINENVTLTAKNFKYMAFNPKGDINFNNGDVTECPGDEETSSVVPIAVGAALAGLVVIVLIAYLIGRRRSRKAGYESV